MSLMLSFTFALFIEISLPIQRPQNWQKARPKNNQNEDRNQEPEEAKITGVQRKQNWQGTRTITSAPQGNQENQSSRSGPQNNSNHNRKYCYYCKLQGH
jgi:hypothetical protein